MADDKKTTDKNAADKSADDKPVTPPVAPTAPASKASQGMYRMSASVAGVGVAGEVLMLTADDPAVIGKFAKPIGASAPTS